MKRLKTIGLVLLLLSTARMARADDFRVEPGFVRWDNGTDLTGWYAATWNGQPRGAADGWSVVEGAIHLHATKASSCLYSKRTHGRDAVIRMQFRAAPGADSGVFLHGEQFQVRDYPAAGPKAYAPAAKPAGQWNDLEFDVTGGVARVTLNGTVIAPAWPIGDQPELGIGLQKEIGDFDFRRIRVKEDKGNG